ncbi:methyltransferase [Bifidobacterium pullorum subsp. saeculare]|uniref:Methyltransferase n=1 Tax=Bifidobacterium pullorum subsp. saeculare TaxID=78257 RepID=A0A939BA29_9BIFI|nr:methyltransferase [Bifidobacterium pullorum]MBM6700158.1 methyltransferase [Bifidobacterium pullorum subsp. saeculare]
MDKTAYGNLAKAWEYAEDEALARQTRVLADSRTLAAQAGMPQGSAAQAAFLRTMVRMAGASSVIAVGTGALVETIELVRGLDGAGQLTAVDSSTQGVALIRRAFARLEESTDTTLRAVNAPVGVFLPRLNGGMYDLIVVSGDAANYAPTFAQAPRLLRRGGAIVFLDVLALGPGDSEGGVPNPADRGDKATSMRALIEAVDTDDGFDASLAPVGTGMLVVVRR